jgi:hypothetical protein
MNVGWPLAGARVFSSAAGLSTFGGSTFIRNNRAGTRNHLAEKCDNNVTVIHSPSDQKFAMTGSSRGVGNQHPVPRVKSNHTNN